MPRVPCVCPCVHPSCLCGQSALRHPGIACVHAFAPTHHRLSLSRVQWSATAASVVPCVRLSFVSHHHPCRPPLRCSCTMFQHSSQHRREQPPAPLQCARSAKHASLWSAHTNGVQMHSAARVFGTCAGGCTPAQHTVFLDGPRGPRGRLRGSGPSGLSPMVVTPAHAATALHAPCEALCPKRAY